MERGIYIVDFEEKGLFSAIDPESLAGSHDAWKKDVAFFAPWTFHSRISGKNKGGIWRAKNYKGPALIWITGACTSSMDVASFFIKEKRMVPWSSVLALEQTEGRGQRQRSWISPAGNIYGTWYWPAAGKNTNQAGYRNIASLLAGDIMASIFHEMGIDARIKWPNDLISGNRKLCGILVEDRQGHLLVGTGINLASAPAETMLADDFVLSPACIDPLGKTFSPLSFWVKAMESGKKRFERITASLRPRQFLKNLEERMAWIGRDVLIRRNAEQPFSANIAGIAPDGGLKILRDAKTEIIYTGTIRLLHPDR